MVLMVLRVMRVLRVYTLYLYNVTRHLLHNSCFKKNVVISDEIIFSVNFKSFY